MKNMTAIEWVIVVAIVLILVAVIFGPGKNEFKQACDESGGTTVWDGRQYQCIKR